MSEPEVFPYCDIIPRDPLTCFMCMSYCYYDFEGECREIVPRIKHNTVTQDVRWPVSSDFRACSSFTLAANALLGPKKIT
jgi:hypothetical protein